MKNNFLEYLKTGYCDRKYDLNKQKIEQFIDSFFRFIFFLEPQRCDSQTEIESRFVSFKNQFKEIINDVKQENTAQICETFFNEIPSIYETLEKDAQFFLESDPAATHIEEIKVSYPGFYAIAIYRFAHQLHLQKVPLIPRIWTELAHSKTGIDIHPGANIGEYFFIDHGTGIVIGETTQIGNRVKIYQNVTLGALAVSKSIANTKRHPTIEDEVTIYAGATILGGKTIIGKGATIGGNVWITESIFPYSLVYYKDKTIIRSQENSPEPINFSI
ncbi:Serine O-acetyltransferase [Capnocytophaga canis]|uniref:serine O-acetyltransferase EpsC n=1 Tax=Capnocytophaga canis TaxID=1848903 RepID=UPI000589AA85|nr:serine O-acetyltransferase EpsC [Capnocytophaga canis]CEN43793.1 Serine O-acetyltransferase [Capnocytophaga canis]